jgi:hypothetical protein
MCQGQILQCTDYAARYFVASSELRRSPSCANSLVLVARGVDIGLHETILMRYNRSLVYFF